MWAAGFSASAVFDIVDGAEQEPRPGLEGRAAAGDRHYRALAVHIAVPLAVYPAEMFHVKHFR
jgi:hypothetical protein